MFYHFLRLKIVIILRSISFQNNLTWKEEKKKSLLWQHAFYCSFFPLAWKQNANFILNSWRKNLVSPITKKRIKYEIESWDHRIMPLKFRYLEKATQLKKKFFNFIELSQNIWTLRHETLQLITINIILSSTGVLTACRLMYIIGSYTHVNYRLFLLFEYIVFMFCVCECYSLKHKKNYIFFWLLENYFIWLKKGQRQL